MLLIKYYQPSKHLTLNNVSLCQNQECPQHITRNYKNISYPTTSLDTFDNIPQQTLQQLFKEQLTTATEEANLLLRHSYLTQWTYEKTLEQYQTFFFYNNHAYNKAEVNNYISKEQAYEQTYISKPIPQQTKPLTEEETHELQNSLRQNNQRWVSRQAIRNITGYTYTPILKWSKNNTPEYIEWQHKLLEDDSRLIIVNGSRQMGKSYTIAEKSIELSHLPNNDILVWWFTTNTTNIIRNYILKYVRKFPKDTFTHYKAERYIINNNTWTKIYFRTLSDDAQSILGMTLKHIIVDEWQLVDEFVYEEVLLPTLSTTWWTLTIILTPWRKRSWYAFKKIMEIKKWLLPKASLYNVDITMNPFIDPETRANVMARRDEPWMRRQYFCEWNDWWDQLFEFQKIAEFPILSPDWFFVLGKDPARLRDRSGYSLIYIYNWKATIIASWYVPDSHKKDWWLQAKFYLNLIENYQKKAFKKWYNTIDVSWVGDWVAKIFSDQWIKFIAKIRYSAGQTESIQWIDYRVGKSLLINTTLDMIQEENISIFESTNKDLLEEVSYLNQTDTRTGLVWMETSFYDDITNATMIAIYTIAKLWLLNRKLQEKQMKGSWIQIVDAIENPNKYYSQEQQWDAW